MERAGQPFELARRWCSRFQQEARPAAAAGAAAAVPRLPPPTSLVLTAQWAALQDRSVQGEAGRRRFRQPITNCGSSEKRHPVPAAAAAAAQASCTRLQHRLQQPLKLGGVCGGQRRRCFCRIRGAPAQRSGLDVCPAGEQRAQRAHQVQQAAQGENVCSRGRGEDKIQLAGGHRACGDRRRHPGVMRLAKHLKQAQQNPYLLQTSGTLF